jgi:hypothetical protein
MLQSASFPPPQPPLGPQPQPLFFYHTHCTVYSGLLFIRAWGREERKLQVLLCDLQRNTVPTGNTSITWPDIQAAALHQIQNTRIEITLLLIHSNPLYLRLFYYRLELYQSPCLIQLTLSPVESHFP